MKRGGAIGFASWPWPRRAWHWIIPACTITEDNADDIGCIYGTGAGGLQSFVEFVQRIRQGRQPRRLHPFAVPMVIERQRLERDRDRLESARPQL